MEIVVGVTQESQSRDALRLAEALATTLQADLVVAHIYPLQFDFAGPARVDAEWRAYLLEESQETLDWAAGHLARPEAAVYVKHGNRSSGNGLIEVAEDRGAGIIVVGSAPGGSEGRITGGSTADQLFHGSPVPVAIAPHGYREWAPPSIARANVAYQQTHESDHCLDITVEALRRNGLELSRTLLLFTVIERVTRIYGSRLGRHAEDQVLLALREQAEGALAAAIERINALAEEPVAIPTTILEGDTVTTALSKRNWDDADIIVTGSTGAGPLRRVFLGDMAYKLIRAATIPVMVIPRSAFVTD